MTEEQQELVYELYDKMYDAINEYKDRLLRDATDDWEVINAVSEQLHESFRFWGS